MLEVSSATEEFIMRDSRTFKAAMHFDSGEKLNTKIISCEVSFTIPEEDISPGMVLSSQASITAAEDIGEVEGRHFYLYLLPILFPGGTTYGDLKTYTHSELHGYTYGEIKELTGEPIAMGRFKATSVRVTGSRTTIEAHDDLYGADGKFTSGRAFPCSSLLIEQDICNALGIKGLKTSFDITLSAAPEDCTYREMLGFIAALDNGKSAMIDRNGYLVHKDIADVSYTVSRARSAEPEAERKAITVTDLTCEVNESTKYETQSTAENIRRITFTNPYMTRSIFNRIAAKLVGLTYTPLGAKYILGDPRLELLDRVTVEGKDKNFVLTPLTGLSFSFDGGLSCNLTAGGRTDSQSRAAEGPMSRYIKSLVASSKSDVEMEFERRMQEAIDYITGANGGYHIQKFNAEGQPTEDWWTDNLDIEKATNIIRINRNGILGTNSGANGPWKTAITNDGRINAAQILTGILSAIVIQSVNYSAANKTGSRIDLSDGTFSFAGGRLVYNGSTLAIEGKVTVSDADSKAVLDDAKLKLERDNKSVGFIGTQTETGKNNRGIVFDLDLDGDYLSWGAQMTEDGNYQQLWTWHRGEGLKASDDIAFTGDDFLISNGNTADIYRNIDMHNYDILNVDIVNASDRRLKENIKDSEVNATEIINALKPKQFDWRESGEHCELGFIADEMQAVRDDFSAALPDGMQGIKLLETVPYLIKAFQELDERVRKLENNT